MANLFSWSDSYSVGIPEIDEQHKKFFVLLNNLGEAMSSGVGKEAVDNTLAGVVNYTVVHFSYEESQMAKCSYPGYLQHKKLHDEFAAHAKELLANARASKSVVSIEVMLALRTWLLDHILKADKLYAPCINRQKAA